MRCHFQSFGSISLTLLLSAGVPILPSRFDFTPQLAQAQTTEDKEAEAKRLEQEALQLYEQGKVEEALDRFQKALVILREIGDRSGEAWMLIGIGLMYDNWGLGQLDRALKHYEQALMILREIGDRAGEGTTLNSIGLVYKSLGKYEQALDTYQQALAIQKEVSDRAGEGTTLNSIGLVYKSLGKYEQALDTYQQALTIYKEIGDRDSERTTLNSIGLVYRILGKYEQALDTYQQALTISKEISDRADEGTIFNNIGAVYNGLGKYEQALDIYQQALAIYQEVGDRAGEGTTLSNIGLVYQNLGKYEQALDYLQQALTIHQEVGNRLMEGTTLNNLGLVYDSLGKYEQTLDTYQQALAILKEIGDQAGEGTILNNIGNLYQSLGQYEQALNYFQQALAILKEVGARPVEGSTLNNIGNVYLSLGQDEQALNYFQQALAIFKEVGARANEGTTLNNIGLIYDSLGKYEQALDTYQQALAIYKEVGDRPGEGTTLNNIGGVYISLGQYKQALDYSQQALVIIKEEKVGDRTGYREGEATILGNIGYILEKNNQPQLAIIFLKQSINTYETIRTDIKGLSQELQQSYTETVADTYRNLADILLSQDRILEAQQVLDLLKVQEFDDYLRGVRGTGQQLAVFKPEEEILKKYNELQKSAVELGTELTQLRDAVRKGNLTLEQEKRLTRLTALEKDLKAQINDFFKEPKVLALVKQLTQVSASETIDPQKFAGLRNQLKTLNAALFYPLILEDRLELVIVVPNSPPLRRTVSVKKADFNSTIVAFRQALDSSTSDVKIPANTLYKWLIEPIKTDLEQAGIKTIIYLPDGQLRYIPLAALYDGKQWLVEQYRVNNITATSLTELESKPTHQPRILAGVFADSSLTYPIRVGEQTVDFQGLPFAGKEVENLVALLPVTVRLVDKEFNLAALEPKMGTNDILHFATHAAFVPGAPENSFILLGSGEYPNLKEIGKWSLQDVDLVVLSACETGLGGKFGDGREILGLGYQFQLAGAKAVIASLWQVNDEGTQALMTAFYGALQEDGITKSEALRQAQIALITGNYEVLGGNRGIVVRERLQANVSAQVRGQLSHPYYWAPFILIGNGL